MRSLAIIGTLAQKCVRGGPQTDTPAVAMNRSRYTTPAGAAVALAGALGWAGVCGAQDRPAEAKPIPPPERVKLSARAGVQHIFETDLDGGGDVNISRGALTLGAETEVSPDLDLVASLRYELSLFEFAGTSDLGADPWDDIHTLSFDVRLQWAMTNDWAVWGGPVIMWSRQDGAVWDDSMAGGAFFGATYVSSEKLIMGGGVGIVSQIEDEALIYPIVILEWKMTDDLRLTTRAGPVGITATGLELVYDLGEGWEIGAGGRYEFRRFRLDGAGIAPGGVGEETNFPLWLRLSYRASENFSIDLYAGLTFSGQLKLDDFNGRQLARADYDNSATAAVVASLRF
jgi:hypothetical protein